MCQCHLKPEMVRRPSSFCFGYFFSTKKFNHITKNVSIFHLKLGDNCRPSYFLISTPLGHTSHHHDRPTHHHDRPIASGWFLTWRNMANLLQVVRFDMGRFWHLVWANSMSCKFSFSFFLFPCTFFKSRVSLWI